MRSVRILKSKASYSNNIIARYIKNEPQTTLPILTAAIFVGALFNKIGFFSAYSIPKELVNFNIFQFFMNSYYVIFGSILILLILYTLLYYISKRAIKIKENIEMEEFANKKEKYIYIINYGNIYLLHREWSCSILSLPISCSFSKSYRCRYDLF